MSDDTVGALLAARAARHEPPQALDGGPDGLDLIRRMFAQARARMNPGGALLLEIEEGHGRAALDLAQRAFPRAKHSIHQDFSGRDRLLRIDLP